MPSYDFLGAGAAERFQAGQCFLAQSYDIQQGISLRLESVDPKMHKEMMRSFLAGRYTHVMPGPYLGIACLYKLPVSLHKDRHDFELSGMMNAGDYVGGILHVPQLGLKFRYVRDNPASLIVFYRVILTAIVLGTSFSYALWTFGTRFGSGWLQ